jgi:hypothetical protein
MNYKQKIYTPRKYTVGMTVEVASPVLTEYELARGN